MKKFIAYSNFTSKYKKLKKKRLLKMNYRIPIIIILFATILRPCYLNKCKLRFKNSTVRKSTKSVYSTTPIQINSPDSFLQDSTDIILISTESINTGTTTSTLTTESSTLTTLTKSCKISNGKVIIFVFNKNFILYFNIYRKKPNESFHKF